MRVGIDGRAAKLYRGTGIGTYTHQLIQSLNNIDFNNDYLIFTPENPELKNLNRNFKIEKVDELLSENFWDEVRVPNILSSSSMEIYHVPQNGVGLSDNINCKKVITLHDIIPLKMPETVSKKYLKIFNDDMPKILDQCDGIITVSEFSKSDIHKEFNFPNEKIFVTHLAAEEIYRPLGKHQCKRILENKYSIKSDFILYVGGFSPRKNILGLIEAYSLLPKPYRKNTKLVITGKKGFSYNLYLNRSRELNVYNDVIFTDFIQLEDLPYFYNASEMLVYPSFYEGFGLPPIEAMACGTPVITSNVTSLPEVCYDSALFINPHDPHELSHAMERVLSDSLLVLAMVKKSFTRSRQFSWEKTAKNTLAAYNTIINE